MCSLQCSMRASLTSDFLLLPVLTSIPTEFPFACRLYAQAFHLNLLTASQNAFSAKAICANPPPTKKNPKLAQSSCLIFLPKSVSKLQLTPFGIIPNRKRKFICFSRFRQQRHGNSITTTVIHDPKFVSKFIPKIECAYLFAFIST